jgi:hypothetical protein
MNTDNHNYFARPTVTDHDGHMVMTDVIRSRKIKYVNIDTRFIQQQQSSTATATATAKTMSSEYSIQLVEMLRDVTSLQVVQMEVPISFHTISERLGNNQFTITDDTSKRVTQYLVPDFYYSHSSIGGLFQVLNGFSALYVFATSPTGFTTIANRSGAPITIDFGTGTNSLDSLGQLLGFRQKTYSITYSPIPIPIPLPLLSESAIDSNPMRYLYLCLEDYSASSSTDFVSYLTHSIVAKKIASRITLGNSQFGTVLYNTPSTTVSNVRLFSNPVNLAKLAFQLVAENGTSINMNGLGYSFVLRVEHE